MFRVNKTLTGSQIRYLLVSKEEEIFFASLVVERVVERENF